MAFPETGRRSGQRYCSQEISSLPSVLPSDLRPAGNGGPTQCRNTYIRFTSLLQQFPFNRCCCCCWSKLTSGSQKWYQILSTEKFNASPFEFLFRFVITNCVLENLGHTHDWSEPKGSRERKFNESLCAFGKLGVFTKSDPLVNVGNLFKYLNCVVISLCFCTCLFVFFFVHFVVPMRISPMGKSGRFPQGKPAATVALPNPN